MRAHLDKVGPGRAEDGGRGQVQADDDDLEENQENQLVDHASPDSFADIEPRTSQVPAPCGQELGRSLS